MMDLDEAVIAASLVSLPYELLLKVLRDPDAKLTHDDFKALRLTCRQLAYGPATRCLFHTVGISRLRRDIDNFIAIGSHPRLAAQVRVIVWHEVASEMSVADWSPFEEDSNWLFPFEQELCRIVNSEVRSLFWSPGAPAVSAKDDAVQMKQGNQDDQAAMISAILPLAQLFRAADSMTAVHTVVSKPMHNDRRLAPSQHSTGYVFTAQVLLGNLGLDRKAETSRVNMNFGFYAFLLPLIATRPPEHPITRLHFSDEGWRSSLIRMQSSLHQHAFRHLTHLDLCISGPDYLKGSSELLQLGECIRAAPNLKSLHICSEKGRSYTTQENLVDTLLIGRVEASPEGDWAPTEPKDPDFKWAGLRELRLTSCTFPANTLADFLRRQSHSLKTLQLYDCQLTAKDLVTIAKASTVTRNLNLERFIIFQSEAGDTDPGFEELPDHGEDVANNPLLLLDRVDEKEVLNLVNGSSHCRNRTARTSFMTELKGMNKKRIIYTHAPIFDADTSYTRLVCDTRASFENVSEMYDAEEIKALDIENGDIRCHDGYSYQRGANFSPQEHSSGMYLKLRNRDLLQAANDDKNEDGDECESEGEGEDAKFEAFDYMDRDPQGLDDDFDDGVRWVVARNPKGEVYYWQENDGAEFEQVPDSSFAQFTSPKYKTEIWRFRHHSGQTALGREPLDYWEDWGGEEAGDIAEALPVGYTMRAFINHTAKPSRNCPQFQCSTEYIKARGGIKYAYKVPTEFYDEPDKELGIFEDYVYRYNWDESELAGWRWSSSRD